MSSTVATWSGSDRRARAAAMDDTIRWRMRRMAVASLLVALCFIQAPGKLVADTKLDLTQNPWGFLERALHLWDGSGFGGQGA